MSAVGHADKRSSGTLTVTTLKSFDPKVLGWALPFAAPDFVLLAPAPFAVSFAGARFGDCWLTVGDTQPPLLTRMSCPRDFFLLGFLLDAQGEGCLNGQPLLPGMCMLAAAGAELYCRTAERTRWAILYIPAGRTPSRMPGLDATAFAIGRKVLRLFQPEEPNATRLFQHIQGLWTLSLGGITVEDGIHRIHRIMDDFFAAYAQAGIGDSPDMTRARSERYHLVRKADAYLRVHGKRRITLSELSRAAGTSEGALRRAFEHILGLPPIYYAHLIRLNGIHQELIEANPEEATVESLRSSWGFSNGVRLAKSYAELFGENPEATLHKKRPIQPLS